MYKMNMKSKIQCKLLDINSNSNLTYERKRKKKVIILFLLKGTNSGVFFLQAFKLPKYLRKQKRLDFYVTNNN